MVDPDLKAISAFRAAFDGRMVHLESVPPVADDEFATARLERFFRQFGDKTVGRDLRWKLWRLHSDIFRDHCEAEGLEFVDAPRSAMDGRFLHPDCHGNGPTHANIVYGAHVIDQLARLASTLLPECAVA